MDRDVLDQLMAEARKAASSNDATAVVDAVDSALADRSDAWGIGTLNLIKSIALQCAPDPSLSATAVEAALESLRRTGDAEKTAYAAAAASVLLLRTGDVERTVDYAVEAMIILPDTDPTHPDSLSATNALAQVFSQLSAFGLSVEMAERAFRHSVNLPMTIRGHYAYALASCVTDASHAVDQDANASWLRLIDDASTYLATDDISPISKFVACGMQAELALLTDDEERFSTVESELVVDRVDDLAIYPMTGERLVPWHRLVRAAAARRWRDPAVAVDLLDLAIPQLDSLGEVLRLGRAMEERLQANMAIGRSEAAVADALELARRSRQWRTEQIGSLADQIAERAKAERTRGQLLRRADVLAKEAAVDAVTGVGTRRWLEVRLDEMARTTALASVVVIDLDHFKLVNDTHGHHVGDRVLDRIGGVLRDVARAADSVARYGGEEFVVVAERTGAAAAERLAERIRRGLAELDWSDIAEGLQVTASIGIADGPARHVRDVLRLADAALYEAKDRGRDRIVVGDGIAPSAPLATGF